MTPREQAREMVLEWRDKGYMRLGTPQVVINDIATVVAEGIKAEREACAKIAKEFGETRGAEFHDVSSMVDGIVVAILDQ